MNINNNKNNYNNINLKSFQVLEKINNLDSKINRENNNKQVSNIKTKEQNTVGRRIKKDGYIENYNYDYKNNGSKIIQHRKISDFQMENSKPKPLFNSFCAWLFLLSFTLATIYFADVKKPSASWQKQIEKEKVQAVIEKIISRTESINQEPSNCPTYESNSKSSISNKTTIVSNKYSIDTSNLVKSHKYSTTNLDQNDELSHQYKSPTFSFDLPESDKKPKKEWVIIAFSDIRYMPATIIWYKQLTKIGYNSHQIIALDSETYQKCLSENLRVSNATMPFNSHSGLRSLWAIRLTTIASFLQSGKNVFISDVDSIWVTYKNLDYLPFPEQIDIYHGLGTTFPPQHFHRYGFVLCGCIGAYRSNPNTIALFKELQKACKTSCDDQKTLNYMYMNVYKFQWFEAPGMKNKIGRSTAFKDLSAMTFSKYDVLRGRFTSINFNERCRVDKPWIVSPNSGKNVAAKLSMFRGIKDCFARGVLEEASFKRK